MNGIQVLSLKNPTAKEIASTEQALTNYGYKIVAVDTDTISGIFKTTHYVDISYIRKENELSKQIEIVLEQTATTEAKAEAIMTLFRNKLKEIIK